MGRIKLYTILLGILLPLIAHAQPLEQTTLYESTTGTLNASSGNTLIAACREKDGSTVTVSDGSNGTWSTAVTRAITASRVGIWYVQSSAAGTLTVTVTGGTVRDCNLTRWSGRTFDTTNNTGNSSVTSHVHGSITPASSALIITALGSTANGGVSADTTNGFTALNIDALADFQKQFYQYKESHTGAVNSTVVAGTSSSSDAVVASFTGGGGGSIRCCGGILRGLISQFWLVDFLSLLMPSPQLIFRNIE